jgi:CBS domain-containing protein
MIREILNDQELITCEPDAKVSDAAKLMADRNVGAVMVLTNDRPRGIITDRDITVRCVGRNLDVSDTTVEQVMTESLDMIRDTDGIYDCIKKMQEAKVHRMPVIDDDGKAVGIISYGDLLAILSKELSILTSHNMPMVEAGQSESSEAA